MKKIIKYLLVTLMFTTAFVSCKKESVSKQSTKSFLLVEFSVAEQEDVSNYVIETSIDAINFTDAGIILATENTEEKYSIKINVTDLFKTNPVVYSRIRSVDIDGKILYSITSATSNSDN